MSDNLCPHIHIQNELLLIIQNISDLLDHLLGLGSLTFKGNKKGKGLGAL